MPLQLRTETVIAPDILRAIVVNSEGRLTDANIAGVLRTIVQEGVTPEFAQRYHALLEVIEACRINEAQGADLDALLLDWKWADAEDVIERLPAVETSGYGTFFSTIDDSGTASAAAASTLTDETKAWVTNIHAGKLLRISAGIGINEERKIASNTATIITIVGTWTTQPQAGSSYEIIDPASSDVDIPEGTVVYAQGPDAETRFRFKTTVVPATAVSSTATGGSAGANPTLEDTGEGWTANEHRGRIVIIRSGSGSGQIGIVISNTPTVLTIQVEFPDTTWATAPDGTSVYDILEGKIPQGGVRAPAAVLATATGSDHNIAANSLTNFEAAAPANIGAVHNTDALAAAADFVTGRNVESDPDLRERFREKLQKLSRGTNPSIIQGILDLEDDLGANPVKSTAIDEDVYPALVYIDDGTGGAGAGLLARVQELIDGTGEFAGNHPLRSSGYKHTATAATGIGVAVIVTIQQIYEGFAYSDVKRNIEGRIQSFFNSLGIGDDVIYNRFLVQAVGPDSGGVVDVATATLNGATTDIAITVGQKAYLSSLQVA
jgi:hypothetical protein